MGAGIEINLRPGTHNSESPSGHSPSLTPPHQKAQSLTLGTQVYRIASFTDSHHVELTTDVITEQIPVTYRIQLGGTVDVSGTAVTLVSGDDFDTLLEGGAITIGGADYTVASVTDTTHLVLTAAAGDQTGAAYSATLPERNTIVTIAGTTVTWISGDLLPAALAGSSFPAGDQVYTVVSVSGRRPQRYPGRGPGATLLDTAGHAHRHGHDKRHGGNPSEAETTLCPDRERWHANRATVSGHGAAARAHGGVL